MEDGRAPLNKDKTPRYKTVGIVLALTATVVLTLILVPIPWLLPHFDRTVRSGEPRRSVSGPGIESDLQRRADRPIAGAGRGAGRGRAFGRPIGARHRPEVLEHVAAQRRSRLLATTAFGNKYVAFISPADPSPQRLQAGDRLAAIGVTTEIQHVVRDHHRHLRSRSTPSR